jgi:hypothetical protein
MPARVKTFADLWRGGSFEARREDHLARLDAAIADNSAPTDPELQPLLEAYEREGSDKRRHKIALQIERASRRTENKSRKLTLPQLMLSLAGPKQRPDEPAAAFRRRQVMHAIWAMEHGVFWRAQHDALVHDDNVWLVETALADGELGEEDVAEYRIAGRAGPAGWNTRIRRLQRQLLEGYNLEWPEPNPPDWAEVSDDPAPEPCECCGEALARFEADGAIAEILARGSAG